ncbi:MAG TPA: 50S ribosomal protein L6 [Candidatus Dormibacteraeota bacterium]|nr:50S ribosomal protein L6 [Candidatus Dormibacteraeota bacterium]
MSRIGRQPIEIPAGVTVTLEASRVLAKGPKGELEAPILPGIKVEQTDGKLTVAKKHESAETIRLYGLARTLIANIVIGVSRGYERKLEINGVGYRANVSGQTINLSLGFSHPIVFALPKGIEAKVEKNVLTISGADKQMVGQVAANIRSLRKPEPYKGKGIKYAEERIRRKAGKTAAKG